MGPLLGRFEFDLSGRTAAWYSLTVLLVFFVLARRLVNSPMGATLKAIRDNRLRAMAIGISVGSRLSVAYTIAAGMAGAAGALLAQTTGFASLDVFDFHRSADVMLMLVIGGTGWLYGGVAGAIVFKLMQDALSAITPQYWTFWLGLFLVVLVLVGRDRLIRPWTWFVAQGSAAMSGEVVLSCEGLVKRFGGITATNNVTLNLQARRPPRADRPQWRGQDDADQSVDRRAGAHRGPHRAGRARTSPGSRRTSACGAAWCAPSRSTSCSTR